MINVLTLGEQMLLTRFADPQPPKYDDLNEHEKRALERLIEKGMLTPDLKPTADGDDISDWLLW